MAASLILALDQGTTSSRAILVDASGGIRASASEELPQIFPGPAQVEHDPEAIWSTQLRTAQRVLAESMTDPASIAATRRDEPARDDDRLGTVDRAAGRERNRLAEPGHGGALRRVASRRPRAALPGPNGPPDRRLLQRAEDRRDPRPDAGPARSRRTRRARLRDCRHVPHLAADRWPGPRDRRLERQPDAPVRHPSARMGPGAVRDRRRARTRCCRRCARRRRSSARPTRGCSGGRSRSPGVPATSRRRRSARHASNRARRR